MEELIKVSNITKVYRLYNKPIDRLKESLSLIKKTKYSTDFNALSDVSFSIRKGETVGIVGTNGSGKSTLLKIITGVLTQTSGEVNVVGRISALLELGAGFNMEYSGIENIYLNGMMMGLSREQVDERINEIIDFADIGEFVNQPVKTYSSGMFARLAFSVAINVNPDILIVDEALSVGDMAFQEKSITKMKELRDRGTTILFVTHSIPLVRNFCTRAIWINKGNLIRDGIAESVCDEFQEYMEEKDKKDKIFKPEHLEKEKTIEIQEVTLDKETYMIDEDIHIKVKLKHNKDNLNYGVGIIIYDTNGRVVTLFNTVRDDIEFKEQLEEVSLIIPENDFVAGTYYITVSIADELAMFSYDKADYIKSFKVRVKKNKNGVPIADGVFRAKHIWSYLNEENLEKL